MKKHAIGRICCMVLLACIWVKDLDAQVDPHFSQYYIQPMTMNPAFTGAFDGDYRISGIWRSQYGNTLNTKGISAEKTTEINANFGFNLINQASNDGAYSFTNGYLTFAYTGVRFGKNADHYLVMAMQLGFISRKFDINKMQFGSQWVSGVGYDASGNSGETFLKPQVTSFDAGAGIAYYDATPNQTASFFGGISAYHITQPVNPFLTDQNQSKLNVRYSAQAGVRINASDQLTIVPTAIYMKQGDAQERMGGVYFQAYANENTDVMFGAYYRISDAITPFAGFYYKGLTFGVSYDVDASAKSAAGSKGNSLEISISYVGKRKSNTGVPRFWCPRF
ncbi:MAG TPA: PorP/SprF family type IX secretion system membrane protein [Puia sp.]